MNRMSRHKMEVEIMNAKQAAKKAAARIADLERMVRLAAKDIQSYYLVIEAMIRGESPCPWCDDYDSCQREERDGKGCGEWMLRFLTPEEMASVTTSEPQDPVILTGPVSVDPEPVEETKDE